MIRNSTLDTLDPKFYPHLIGHVECSIEDREKEEITNIFRQRPQLQAPVKKTHILFPEDYNWVLKRPKDGRYPDSHLYRVRKAKKVSEYIQEHHLENFFTVPKMWIVYQNSLFYTVCEKISFSEEVGEISSRWLDQSIQSTPLRKLSGQLKAYKNGKPQRAVTAPQAKALAAMAFQFQLTGLDFNNLFFTEDHKIALIDFEPETRDIKKAQLKGSAWITGKRAHMTFLLALCALSKLKTYCSNDALKEVEDVERSYALKHLATRIARLSAVLLGLTLSALFNIYILPQMGLIAGITVSLLSTSFIGFFGSFLAIRSLTQIQQTWHFWSLCSENSKASYLALAALEKKGISNDFFSVLG
jgi:hypothetical protein